MFGRRKSNDGFEWHKYVRTTIKLKREQRRQRIVDARRAAVHQAGEAGVALAAGSRAAGAAALDGARVGLGVAGLALQAAVEHRGDRVRDCLAQSCDLVGGRRTEAGDPAAASSSPALERPDIGEVPLRLPAPSRSPWELAAIAAPVSTGRRPLPWRSVSSCCIAALPLLSNLTGIRLPRLSALGISPRVGFIAVTAACGRLRASPGWRAAAGPTSPASRASFPWSVAPSRCRAAPRRSAATCCASPAPPCGSPASRPPSASRSCGTGSRRYRCGAAAQAALGKLVNGRTPQPARSAAPTAPGRPLATCTRGELDINGELVRQGHVFAGSGLFASYSGLERQARDAKSGIWAAGDAERPERVPRQGLGRSQAPRTRRLSDQGPGDRRRARLRAARVTRLRTRPHPEGARRALVLLRARGRSRRLQAGRAGLIGPSVASASSAATATSSPRSPIWWARQMRKTPRSWASSWPMRPISQARYCRAASALPSCRPWVKNRKSMQSASARIVRAWRRRAGLRRARPRDRLRASGRRGSRPRRDRAQRAPATPRSSATSATVLDVSATAFAISGRIDQRACGMWPAR